MFGNVKAPGLMVRGCFRYLLRQEDKYLNNITINAREPDYSDSLKYASANAYPNSRKVQYHSSCGNAMAVL